MSIRDTIKISLFSEHMKMCVLIPRIWRPNDHDISCYANFQAQFPHKDTYIFLKIILAAALSSFQLFWARKLLT